MMSFMKSWFVWGNIKWIIKRRYSEFKNIYNALNQFIGNQGIFKNATSRTNLLSSDVKFEVVNLNRSKTKQTYAIYMLP